MVNPISKIAFQRRLHKKIMQHILLVSGLSPSQNDGHGRTVRQSRTSVERRRVTRVGGPNPIIGLTNREPNRLRGYCDGAGDSSHRLIRSSSQDFVRIENDLPFVLLYIPCEFSEFRIGLSEFRIAKILFLSALCLASATPPRFPLTTNLCSGFTELATTKSTETNIICHKMYVSSFLGHQKWVLVGA